MLGAGAAILLKRAAEFGQGDNDGIVEDIAKNRFQSADDTVEFAKLFRMLTAVATLPGMSIEPANIEYGNTRPVRIG